eukprot:EG_transcript_8392
MSFGTPALAPAFLPGAPPLGRRGGPDPLGETGDVAVSSNGGARSTPTPPPELAPPLLHTPAPTPHPPTEEGDWTLCPPRPGAHFRFLPPVVHKVEDQRPLEKVHYVYAIQTKTDLPQYYRPQMRVERRYNDFLWFREVLASEHPALIIPPLPPKHLPVEKVVDIDVSDQLASRCRQLHRFLEAIGDHPGLQTSPTVQAFLELPSRQWQSWRKHKSTLAVSGGISPWEAFLRELTMFLHSLHAPSGPHPLRYVGDLAGDWRTYNKDTLEGHRRHLVDQLEALKQLRHSLGPCAKWARDTAVTHNAIPPVLAQWARLERRCGDAELAKTLMTVTADLNLGVLMEAPGDEEFGAQLRETSDILQWITGETAAALDCIADNAKQRRAAEELRGEVGRKLERLAALAAAPTDEAARRPLEEDVQVLQHRLDWAEEQLKQADETLLREMFRLHAAQTGQLQELCTMVQGLLSRPRERAYCRLHASDVLRD